MESAESKRLAGKVAIVTGASRGIGRGIALRLARDGASVVVNYARDEAAAKGVVNAIDSEGGRALLAHADLSKLPDVRRLFEHAAERLGRLDILVNNAGTATFGPIADLTEQDYASLFNLNVRGVLFCLQEAARRMEFGGRIVNISSGITIAGSAGAALYASSKAAVEQFTISAAKELAPRAITVNTVSPGFVKTDLFDSLASPEEQQELAKTIPLGRIGRPEDIADVVAFLASDDGRWITGQNIRATGGGS